MVAERGIVDIMEPRAQLDRIGRVSDNPSQVRNVVVGDIDWTLTGHR